jgi:hypothetical protein
MPVSIIGIELLTAAPIADPTTEPANLFIFLVTDEDNF